MFMLGAAWQKGLVPIRREAIERAIELDGVAIDANKQAFEWGRRAAHDPVSVETLVGFDEPADQPQPLDALIARRVAHLTDYRNAAYASAIRRSSNACARPNRGAGLGEALTTPSRAPITSCSRSRTSGRSRACSRA